MEAQEGFNGAAHEEVARRLAGAVDERTRLPVCFEAPEPASPEDRPPADDPPEETYEDCPWAGGEGSGGEDRIDGDRADGAEHDWLYQRRNGYDEIYDPWAPEEVGQRTRNRLERQERGGGEDGDWSGLATKKKKKKRGRKTGPEGAGSAPDHDRS